MSSPEDLYPNADRRYPNYEDEPTFEPGFEAQLRRLAPSRITVLLTGGTPAAQYAAAQALHGFSARAASAFVVFDCRGLEHEAVEHGLFGGPDYAPTRDGAIQRADSGTLYVAAIDELPLLVQPRFLRLLDQERKARVVASAADLVGQVERGVFRLDLAERLTLVELILPLVQTLARDTQR
ncbi:MAG: sigma 54-interacting transcriptional regulator [Myxococcales bacterium]